MKFKPNLIPNNQGEKSDIYDIIEKRGVENYMITFKKDGVRMEFLPTGMFSRAMHTPRSQNVIDRFQKLADVCKKENLVLEGEFFSRNMGFNEILRFYSNANITGPKELKKLETMSNRFLIGYKEGDPVYAKERSSASQITQLEEKYGERSIEWLTTFHDDLQLWLFDGFVIGHDQWGYQQRMNEVIEILSQYDLEDILVFPTFMRASSIQEIEELYEEALNDEWEGLVLTHQDHKYKFNRCSLKEGEILKLKDDKNEYDGVVIDIVEGTQIKDGVDRTTTELGYSRTSKCKDDRQESGLAKGIVCEYEGERFIVGLKGFPNEKRRQLLERKRRYIGRHFKYTGMNPVKKVPRHAYFMCWRDDK